MYAHTTRKHTYITHTLLDHLLVKVVAIHDCTSIYRVPLLLKQQAVLDFVIKRLELPIMTGASSPQTIYKWRNLAER